MWQKIKQWPASVKVSIVVLFVLWSTLCIAIPIVGIPVTILMAFIGSIIRIVSYFMDGQ